MAGRTVFQDDLNDRCPVKRESPLPCQFMAKIISFRGQFARTAGVLLIFAACCGQPLVARDAFVVLSGGGSPMENNYSQYLQAKALATYFEQNYPPDSVWVFFGAGNVEGERPVLGDVRREINRDGIVLDSWVAGALRPNLPARHDVILRTFREEILPAVANGGTLFLFVGDHGSRTRGREGESHIDLWSLERDPDSEHGWRSNEDESLGVAELRRTLAKGIGKGRVVFCMTQCHSGGFHYLAVPHEMTANPRWFTVVPSWMTPKAAPAYPRAAGFTATDEFSLASGCDPDPDPANWAGYERFIPQKLFGTDLLTGQRIGKPLRSFAEAHVAATLQDATIDKPYSTSEQYLERWASLIETRLAKASNLTEKAKKGVAAYQRTVDGGTPRVSEPAFRERELTFRRFIEKLSENDPAAKTFLLTSTRKQLEAAAGPVRAQSPMQGEASLASGTEQQPQQRPMRRRGGGSQAARKLWKETVRPAWKASFEANQVTNVLPAAAREFEKYLLKKEDEGRNYFFGGASSMQREIFWQSGYSDPETVDLAKAEAVARWGVERRNKILAWAKTAKDEKVRAAAETILQRQSRRQQNPAPTGESVDTSPEPVSEKTAAERTLFYRRVLAAWEFLLAVNEEPALARLRELTELERTPLPPPKT
jgi:hypothetical protein